MRHGSYLIPYMLFAHLNFILEIPTLLLFPNPFLNYLMYKTYECNIYAYKICIHTLLRKKEGKHGLWRQRIPFHCQLRHLLSRRYLVLIYHAGIFQHYYVSGKTVHGRIQNWQNSISDIFCNSNLEKITYSKHQNA